jgi:amidase
MSLGPLTAYAAAKRLSQGSLTSVELVGSCLEQIEAREAAVGAWAFLDPTAALAAAAAADRRLRSGPLAGLPVGIKDIIDTADMPTTYGSPIYATYRPKADATCVQRLRDAGAVVLGKTVTTEFAYFTPGKTCNPHNVGHTPGGSSSGSAAAVADCMVPVALGTQTAGSVIRPAAFCGVIGFKGSHSWTPVTGIKPFAPTLDTLGLLARDLDDIELFRAILAGETFHPLPHDGKAPRIGFCRTAHWDQAEPATRAALETAATLLAESGAKLSDLDLLPDSSALNAAQNVIMAAEAAQSYAAEYQQHRNQLSAPLQAFIAEGQALPPTAVVEAGAVAGKARQALSRAFHDIDVILTPAALGEAPKDIARTGDPLFNRGWTLLGVPCVTLPVARGPKGLPIGIQLVGALGQDRRLLETAAWVAARVGQQIPVCIL